MLLKSSMLTLKFNNYKKLKKKKFLNFFKREKLKKLQNFEFYYKIRIKNRLYRVNKIEYKPYELSSVELILLS